MTAAQLLFVVAAVLAAFDAFATPAWGRFSRLAAAVALVALALAIVGTGFSDSPLLG